MKRAFLQLASFLLVMLSASGPANAAVLRLKYPLLGFTNGSFQFFQVPSLAIDQSKLGQAQLKVDGKLSAVGVVGCVFTDISRCDGETFEGNGAIGYYFYAFQGLDVKANYQNVHAFHLAGGKLGESFGSAYAFREQLMGNVILGRPLTVDSDTSIGAQGMNICALFQEYAPFCLTSTVIVSDLSMIIDVPVLGDLSDADLTAAAASGYRLRAVGAGAVPEASTWALMIVGFGVVGAAMRTGARPVMLRR